MRSGAGRGPESDGKNRVRYTLESPEIVKDRTDDLRAEARLSGLRSKAFLAQAEGGTISADEAAEVLGLTRQGVDQRRRAGRLLALTLGRRGYRYPLWQFSGHGMLPGLEDTLRALDSFEEWAQASWFINPNMDLDGHSPLTLLRQGHSEPVIQAARRYGEMGVRTGRLHPAIPDQGHVVLAAAWPCRGRGVLYTPSSLPPDVCNTPLPTGNCPRD